MTTPVATFTTTSVVMPQHRRPLAIDLGKCQQTALRALVEARAAQRAATGDSDGFLARASSLFSSHKQSLCAMIDRKTPLSKLARMGVIPADIVQSQNMSFGRLRSAYDLQSLVEYGFTWQHMLQLGFDVDDLTHVSAEEFRSMGVTAETLMRDMPLTGQDLVNLKLQPHVLRELKFNFNHFLKLELKQEQLATMMSTSDLQTYFAPTKQQIDMMRAPRQTPTAASSATSSAASSAAPAAFAPAPRSKGKLSF